MSAFMYNDNYNSKVTFLSGALTSLKLHFQASDAELKMKADETISALKTLINTCRRRLVVSVVERIKKQQYKVAREKMLDNFPTMHAGNLEDILQLSYNDADDIVTLLSFVCGVGQEWLAVGYSAIYKEMEFRDHRTDPSILLLQRLIWDFRDDTEELKTTRQGVDADCKVLVEMTVKEIKTGTTCVLGESLNEVCDGHDVLEKHMQNVVNTVYSGSLDDTFMLIDYLRKMPFGSSWCYVVNSAVLVLKEQNQCESEQAMHLRAYAVYIANDSGDHSTLEIGALQALEKSLKTLFKHREKYFEIYRSYIERPDKKCIAELHKRNPSLNSFLPDFVKWYCHGNLEKVQHVIELANNLHLCECVGRVQKCLYRELEENAQLATFEAFQIYNSAKKVSTWNVHYPLMKPSKKADTEYVKERIPKCLSDILWCDTGTCRIINKFYSEALFPDETAANQIFSYVPIEVKENQFWTVNVGVDTSLLQILHRGSRSRFLRSLQNSQSVEVSDQKQEWKIKAVDDEFVKIYLHPDTFLSAGGDVASTESRRKIYLRPENKTDRQLWRIEIVPKSVAAVKSPSRFSSSFQMNIGHDLTEHHTDASEN